MSISHFNLDIVDASWQACIKEGLKQMDPSYLNKLLQNKQWLPGHDKIFNAFSIPVNKINYVLFGESPYPRAISANGYAFWDAAVDEIWCENGLSKPVNRATSLRNLIKMLLLTEGLLQPTQLSQADIAAVNKTKLVKTNKQFFNNLLNHGFLLLNISLVLQSTPVKKDALAWQPFIKHVLHFLLQKKPNVKLILLGQIAKTIDQLLGLPDVTKIYSEHPYNLSFIHNKTILDFFKPLHLILE